MDKMTKSKVRSSLWWQLAAIPPGPREDLEYGLRRKLVERVKADTIAQHEIEGRL